MKYACGVCGINLISHRAKRDISQLALANYFILLAIFHLQQAEFSFGLFFFAGFGITNPMLAAICDMMSCKEHKLCYNLYGGLSMNSIIEEYIQQNKLCT